MTDFILPISIALGLFTYGLIAKRYFVPWMDSVSRPAALSPILRSFGTLGLGAPVAAFGAATESSSGAYRNPPPSFLSRHHHP